MIGLDTNFLARYYIDDTTDPEAKRQRPYRSAL
jgi:predicted nucleic-acid-binding protein